MYFPYVSRHLPSNRECRVASVLSISGFVGFTGLVLAVPSVLVQMLLWLAAVLVLTYLGLGTLYIAKPNHFLLWPQRATREVLGQPIPPLDERDLTIRYRTFLVSYRILAVAAFAMIAFIRPGAVLLVHISAGYIPRWRLDGAEQTLLVLIFCLALFLPYWVFPWLESEAVFDDEQNSDSGIQSIIGPPLRLRQWIRSGIALLAIWVPIFLLMAWMYRKYVH
jgi:hypothetical protein